MIKKIMLIMRGILVFWGGMLCLLQVKQTAYAAGSILLKGEISGDQEVLLSWTTAGTDYIYQLQRADSPEGPYSTLAQIRGESEILSCHDDNVKLGKTYYYKVSCLLDGQVARESTVVSVLVTLPAPKNVKASKMKESRVTLSWNKVKGADGYLIFRSTRKTSGYKKLTDTEKNVYTDASVKHGKAYYYKIKAYKEKNKSLTSGTTQYVSIYMRPSAPELTGVYSKKKIRLSWKQVKGAKEYYLYQKNKKGKYCLLEKTDKLYYWDGKVEKGKSYEYRIVAAYQRDGKVIKSQNSKTCTVFASAINPKKKMVALTFDDGPGRYTGEIVRCLKKYNSRATFFVLGCHVDSYKSALKAADKAGCEIGNHSYNHKNLTRLSSKEVKAQMGDTDKKVKNVIGKKPSIMRTPGGATNTKVQKAVGKPVILWSIDTLDWKTRNSDKTVKAVLNNVKDGDIVLMHDIHEPSKEAALILIKELNRRGYQLVTVSELAQYRGYNLKKGSIYHSLRKK